LFGGLLIELTFVDLVELTVLDKSPVVLDRILPVSLTKHVGDLSFVHINSIFSKESCDFTTIECATAILIQTFEQVVHD
jgi:hypothetical protein